MAEQVDRERHCGSTGTHDGHQWSHAEREARAVAAGLPPRQLRAGDEIVWTCPGNEHVPHDQRCCREHRTHSSPHIGCILR